MKVFKKCFSTGNLKRYSITCKEKLHTALLARNHSKHSKHLNRHNAQVHTSQKNKKVTKPIDPEMFIDISLLINYFGDSSDSDDFIPLMDDHSDIDMVIEPKTEGILFSCSTFFQNLS